MAVQLSDGLTKFAPTSFVGFVRLRSQQLVIYGAAGGVMLAALAVYLPTLAPSITWSHGGADSGDLAAAVAVLGIAHPPGYPTYILLGHIWAGLPLGGDIAYRLNLLSAVSAAGAAGITVLTIIQLAWHCGLLSSDGKLPAVGAAGGGLFLALAPITWSQAAITEVYAPGLFWLAALGWLLFEWTIRPQPRLLFGAGLLIGLGFGLLPQIVLAGPGLLFLLIQQKKFERASMGLWKSALLLSVGVMSGLSVFIYLPIRAAAQPFINWGDPSTPARFWAVVTAAQYHRYAGLLTWSDWFNRLPDSLAQLNHALSWAGLGLAVLGGYVLWRRGRGTLAYLLSLTALTLLFRTGYPVAANIVYLLPAIYGLSLLTGVGAIWLLAAAQRQVGWKGAMVAGLALLVTLGIRAAALGPQLDISRDEAALRFGQQVFAALPENAVVISRQDETTFSLWYRQALGERPDVIVVDKRLLAFDWYTTQLELRHPALNVTNTRRPRCLLGILSPEQIRDRETRFASPNSKLFTCTRE